MVATNRLCPLFWGAAPFRKNILSLGSGDGSQQVALMKHGAGYFPETLQTTFFDTKEEVLRKYPQAKNNVDFLQAHGRRPPLFEVDVAELPNRHDIIQGALFDLIFFTNPHTGLSNSDPQNIKSNQELLQQTLRSGAKVLSEAGEIHIVLKKGYPYDEWWPGVEAALSEGHLIYHSTSPFVRLEGHTTCSTRGGKVRVSNKQPFEVHIFQHRDKIIDSFQFIVSSSDILDHKEMLH